MLCLQVLLCVCFGLYSHQVHYFPTASPFTQFDNPFLRGFTTPLPPCIATPTTVGGKPSCKDKLIFEENFSGTEGAQWIAENRFSGFPDYGFVLYYDDNENLRAENGILRIKPTLIEDKYGVGIVANSEGINLGKRCTGLAATDECMQTPKGWHILPPVISAQITTRTLFSFAYGIVEIRAKLPKGDWICPELYLKPKDSYYGPGIDSGTIKIAFVPGNSVWSNQLSGGCILGLSDNARSYGIKTVNGSRNWTDNFHVFRLEWDIDEIRLSVDNQQYGSIQPPIGGFASEEEHLGIDSKTAEVWRKGTRFAPFDKEMYVSLGVGVGGQCFLDKDVANKPWSNDDPKAQRNFYLKQDVWKRTWNANSELLVDYIKIWSL